MNLCSFYLNPFQPFPERQLDGKGGESPRDALEDNLSRAVFSALGNAGSSHALALFLNDLATHASPLLRERTQAIAEILRTTDATKINVGLQTWPDQAVAECPGRNVLLVGISSAHYRDFTHEQRSAPVHPRADAWIHVPNAVLVVFECKNDRHPLDATQVSAYAHHLRLPTWNDLPCPEPGSTLSLEEARTVQKACENLVLDAHWDAVVAALGHLQQTECAGPVGQWLFHQAASYIQRHVHPPYRDVQTILGWLNGPDDADRREHLRTLVREMGKRLAIAASAHQGAITFDHEDMRPGAGAALYVRLRRGGQPLTRRWLGREAPVVLWFQFTEGLQLSAAENKCIGLEYYIQARGAQPDERKGVHEVTAWNAASDRHIEFAKIFEQKVADWCAKASPASKVEVTSVKFNGKKRNWQGGGVYDNTGPGLPQANPQEVLAFLKAGRSELWRFPRVENGGATTVAEAARQVRKPALALMAPLEASALAACGEDAFGLQKVLQEAIAGIDARIVAEAVSRREAIRCAQA
jgi:hypothetical protein